MRARHADHLDRKVLADFQEERKPGQAQAVGAHVRDPAHQLGSVRASHGRRYVDGKPLVGTRGLRQVLHDRGKIRRRKFKPPSYDLRAILRAHPSACQAGDVRTGEGEFHKDPLTVAMWKLGWVEEQASPTHLVKVQRDIRGGTEPIPDESYRGQSGFRISGVEHGEQCASGRIRPILPRAPWVSTSAVTNRGSGQTRPVAIRGATRRVSGRSGRVLEPGPSVAF
jgi:hypothetical protein